MEMLAAVLGGDGLAPVAELAAAAAGGPVVIVAPGSAGLGAHHRRPSIR